MISEANRYLSQGAAGLIGSAHSSGYYVAAALAWCVGILVLAVGAAVALFRRR
ncbi:hypothetical protein [Nocardia crassostreae]|uniref:hypothetical protein n=1 Tax=Nocardia crassostreae TaxID=53428 RepID=UPI000A7A5210|nr:hypothetical protein [Nocardia crassostreae]